MDHCCDAVRVVSTAFIYFFDQSFVDFHDFVLPRLRFSLVCTASIIPDFFGLLAVPSIIIKHCRKYSAALSTVPS